MKNFESNLERLEQLSENIKRSNITLEEALKSFEEGIKLAKGMEKELDSIEGRIQILMNGDSLPEEKNLQRKLQVQKKSLFLTSLAEQLSLTEPAPDSYYGRKRFHKNDV